MSSTPPSPAPPPAPEPTRISVALLTRAEAGDQAASDELFVIVYDELRRMAAGLLSRERVGHTLQPTALVHEAYLRLLGPEDIRWNGRGHFFGAAAQAMRRILVERARRARVKRADIDPGIIIEPTPNPDGLPIDILALNEALERLESHEPLQAQIVMLRYFAGLTNEQTADALDLSPATIKKEWAYARAWLKREMEHGHAPGEGSSDISGGGSV